MAAYGKTELWQAALSCDVSDFDSKNMAPSEAFLPTKVRHYHPTQWLPRHTMAPDPVVAPVTCHVNRHHLSILLGLEKFWGCTTRVWKMVTNKHEDFSFRELNIAHPRLRWLRPTRKNTMPNRDNESVALCGRMKQKCSTPMTSIPMQGKFGCDE